MGQQPGSIGYVNGPTMMGMAGHGSSLFTNEMFGMPPTLSAIDMMNSELIQKQMMTQSQTQPNEESMAYAQNPTYSQVPSEKPRFSWVEWFCSLEGHEFLLKVDTNFIKDRINLICLNDKALGIQFDRKRIEECLKLLLSKQQPSEEDLQNEQFLQLNQDTSDLYTVIHARYIRSPEGKINSA